MSVWFGPSARRFVLLFAPAALFATVVGCGSGGTPQIPTGPAPAGNTTVALQLASTGNDQLTEFGMTIDSISLTNQAGKTTTIFSTPATVDLLQANGNSIPLAVVPVPQDTYTSAAVTVDYPYFSYIFRDTSGSMNFQTDQVRGTLSSTVKLAAPLTVSGSTMGITLDLQTVSSFVVNAIPFKITPVFNLTGFAPAATPTAAQKSTGTAGRITAASGTSMTVALSNSAVPANANAQQSMAVSLSSNTVFQGVASAAQLAPGTFINMDLALQPDASYQATRVEVQDKVAVDIAEGPIWEVNPSTNYFGLAPQVEQGKDLTPLPFDFEIAYVPAGTTVFQTSARFAGVSGLPFPAVFDEASLAAGQRVSVGSSNISHVAPSYTTPTTVTLMPQTINATVTGASTAGNYSVYTVQLAPYDPIVQLNTPATGTTDTFLAHPQTVNVYISSTTAQNAGTPAAGQTYRFEGLLFNDAGTLRMVCDQVNTGLAL